MDDTQQKSNEAASSLKDITSDLLRNVLYSKWLAWGGAAPSESVQNSVLRAIPKETGLTTPKEVRFGISSLPGSPIGVFASDWIKEGTEMGPYTGSTRPVSEIKGSNELAWEVFSPNGEVKQIVDVDESQKSCWMVYIQCARHEQEQNLETFQVGDAIFYRATTTIHPGQELLVWYGSDVNQYLGVPEVSYPGYDKDEKQLVEGSIKHSSIPSSNGRLKCVVCRRGFNSRSNLRSHMRIHTMERPFVCEYCSRSFSQSSTLRNHLRLHTGEKPYKCQMCRSAYSQLAGLRAHQKSSRHRPLAATRTVTQLKDS